MEEINSENYGGQEVTHTIRPRLDQGQIEMRERPSGPAARKMKKALLTLHTLELMAVNIYRYQITGARDEINRRLTEAMINEMSHLQDFQRKLFEYGWRPSRLRWAYWIVGWVFGAFSRALGTAARLRTGIWVESKAVRHYSELLEQVDWDEETRLMIEKNRDDESIHIESWKQLLSSL